MILKLAYSNFKLEKIAEFSNLNAFLYGGKYEKITI